MYTFYAFAKNKNMKRITKILLIIFFVTLLPTLFMGKSIIDGIIPTDKGFKLIFSTQGIIALILAIITLVLGTILFIRFILSLPVDKAIFF